MKGLKKVIAAVCSVALLAGSFGATKAEAFTAKRDFFDDKHMEVFSEDAEDPDILGATQYNLFVGNVQVTSDNMKDIPGVTGGKASYNPATNTLTLTNVTGVKTPLQVNGGKVDIYSELKELKIEGTAKFDNKASVGIWARTTKLTVTANLTIKSEVAGIIAKELVINGGKTDIDARGLDNSSKAYGVYAYDGLTINAGTLKSYATSGGIGALKGTININGGTIDTCGSESAITFLNNVGEIKISDKMRIAKPAGARVSADKTRIVDAKGNDVMSIIIIPVKDLTGTVTVSLDSKNPGTLVAKVTKSNAYSFKYQWYRDGKKISKATGSSYKVTDSDLNKAITCTVTDAQEEMLGSISSDANGKVVAKDKSGKIIFKDDSRVEYFFKDVEKGAWYVSAVQFVYENGVMNGTGANTFEPMKVLTRAEFVTVLHNLEGKPNVAYKNTFKDVPKGKWFTTPVMWAYKNEITNGVSKTEFGTDTKITREQLATMLYKYAKVKKYKTTFDKKALNSFSDKNKVSSWATEAMQWAVSNGVMSGKGQEDGSKLLDPAGQATRAECAQMIKNLNDKVIKK